MSNSYRPNRQYISGNPACGGHYHALPLTDVLRIHKRKYREPGKVEYGTAIYRCPVLLGQISVAARSLLSLAAIIIIIIVIIIIVIISLETVCGFGGKSETLKHHRHRSHRKKIQRPTFRALAFVRVNPESMN